LCPLLVMKATGELHPATFCALLTSHDVRFLRIGRDVTSVPVATRSRDNNNDLDPPSYTVPSAASDERPFCHLASIWLQVCRYGWAWYSWTREVSYTVRHQNMDSCALLPQMATDLRTVYVGNLTVAADEKALRSVFETCGEVTQVRLAGCAAQQCCV